MYTISTIAEKLVECRGNKTQAMVAKETGLAQSTIAMWELGERVPTDKNKIVLAKYYNKTVEELFFSQ